MTWIPVCTLATIQPERPVAALLPTGQVALVRTHEDTVYALDNLDPLCQAPVMARGIVGTRAGVPILVSPMLKQAYDLRTGACLDRQGVAVAVHPVRVVGGTIEIRVAANNAADAAADGHAANRDRSG